MDATVEKSKQLKAKSVVDQNWIGYFANIDEKEYFTVSLSTIL